MPLDNSENLSSDQLKEQIEQTEVEEEPEERQAQEAEAVEAESTEEQEAETQDTEKTETEETEEAKEDKDKTYRIKVEGKEEDLTREQVIKYAQQGRYLEREKARLRAQIEEGQRQTKAGPQVPPEELNKWFVEEANRNPLGAIMTVQQMMRQQEREQEKTERMTERKFELDASEQYGELWKHLKPRYQEFRDYGLESETALAKAEADFYKEQAIAAMQRGVEKGKRKTVAKMKASIPSGSKKTKAPTGLPSPEDFDKLSYKEMEKFLRKVKNPGY